MGWKGERVGIDRRSGVEGGESGDREKEEWVGEVESGDRSGVGGGEWGTRGLIHETDLRGKLRPKHEVRNYRRKVAIHESGQREVAT